MKTFDDGIKLDMSGYDTANRAVTVRWTNSGFDAYNYTGGERKASKGHSTHAKAKKAFKGSDNTPSYYIVSKDGHPIDLIRVDVWGSMSVPETYTGKPNHRPSQYWPMKDGCKYTPIDQQAFIDLSPAAKGFKPKGETNKAKGNRHDESKRLEVMDLLDRGFNVSQASEKAGVSRKTVRRWVGGHSQNMATQYPRVGKVGTPSESRIDTRPKQAFSGDPRSTGGVQ